MVPEKPERVITVKHVSLDSEKEKKAMETEPDGIITAGCQQLWVVLRGNLRNIPSLSLRT